MATVRILTAVSHKGQNLKVGDVATIPDEDLEEFEAHGWGERTDETPTAPAAASSSESTPSDGAGAGGDSGSGGPAPSE